MTAHPDDRRAAHARTQPWLKLAALILVVAALGLPVNDLFRYALLVISTVLVVAGTVAARVAPWLAALAVVGVCVLAQILFPAPRIEEGHNVFLIDDAGGDASKELSVHSRESGNPGAPDRGSGSPQRGPRDDKHGRDHEQRVTEEVVDGQPQRRDHEDERGELEPRLRVRLRGSAISGICGVQCSAPGFAGRYRLASPLSNTRANRGPPSS